MHIFSYLKAVFVLLLTFVLTALFMLMLYGVQMLAFPKNLNDIAIGFAGASIVLFAGACLQYFAKSFLYDKDDRAELQLLGGVGFGDTVVEAMLAMLRCSSSVSYTHLDVYKRQPFRGW